MDSISLLFKPNSSNEVIFRILSGIVFNLTELLEIFRTCNFVGTVSIVVRTHDNASGSGSSLGSCSCSGLGLTNVLFFKYSFFNFDFKSHRENEMNVHPSSSSDDKETSFSKTLV